MAEDQAVWGIDIGQAGLKAIRLRYAESAKQVLAVAFDYVPHPKLLSQPDANPEELISQALATFLSRNEVKGDKIAISVPGQTALARFIQLPPVESSKVGEIVKYEARQQIPFALEDVIWDYQNIGGGIEESGFMLGAEVGLFAMKREQVLEHLQPFVDRKIEVDIIQIAPLAIHNFVCYDLIGIRPDEDVAGSDEHTIVLDMGADNTTLLVTNGEKIWIRNVPIGGNHFTRALTKEMKLTFAKAEHLKCNATKSPDPRAVFQALRPVFNDYVSEIQRSIGYFSSVSREAKIAKIIGVGNGFRLAGLQKFLQQNLQYEVERVDTFQAAVGDTVLNAPVFQENILTFVVPYGLALQTLELSRITTTLLPPEIATARKIRGKKPWAVATAATLLFGLAMSSAAFSNVANSVSTGRFGDAEGKVKNFTKKVNDLKSGYGQAEAETKKLNEQGEQLVTALPGREYWPELYRAINECLPRDIGDQLDEADITKKNRINVLSVTSKRYTNLQDWFNGLHESQKADMLQIDIDNPPQGDGYVVSLRGEHYHSSDQKSRSGRMMRGILYVKDTLVENLRQPTMLQGDAPTGSAPVPVRRLGITHGAIVERVARQAVQYNPRKRNAARKTTGSKLPMAGGLTANPAGRRPATRTTGKSNETRTIERTTFTLQFVWKPTPIAERTDNLPEATPVPATTPGALPGTAKPGTVAPPGNPATPK